MHETQNKNPSSHLHSSYHSNKYSSNASQIQSHSKSRKSLIDSSSNDETRRLTGLELDAPQVISGCLSVLCGLPGSGKTSFCNRVKKLFTKESSDSKYANKSDNGCTIKLLIVDVDSELGAISITQENSYKTAREDVFRKLDMILYDLIILKKEPNMKLMSNLTILEIEEKQLEENFRLLASGPARSKSTISHDLSKDFNYLSKNVTSMKFNHEGGVRSANSKLGNSASKSFDYQNPNLDIDNREKSIHKNINIENFIGGELLGDNTFKNNPNTKSAYNKKIERASDCNILTDKVPHYDVFSENLAINDNTSSTHTNKNFGFFDDTTTKNKNFGFFDDTNANKQFSFDIDNLNDKFDIYDKNKTNIFKNNSFRSFDENKTFTDFDLDKNHSIDNSNYGFPLLKSEKNKNYKGHSELGITPNVASGIHGNDVNFACHTTTEIHEKRSEPYLINCDNLNARSKKEGRSSIFKATSFNATKEPNIDAGNDVFSFFCQPISDVRNCKTGKLTDYHGESDNILIQSKCGFKSDSGTKLSDKKCFGFYNGQSYLDTNKYQQNLDKDNHELFDSRLKDDLLNCSIFQTNDDTYCQFPTVANLETGSRVISDDTHRQSTTINNLENGSNIINDERKVNVCYEPDKYDAKITKNIFEHNGNLNASCDSTHKNDDSTCFRKVNSDQDAVSIANTNASSLFEKKDNTSYQVNSTYSNINQQVNSTYSNINQQVDSTFMNKQEIDDQLLGDESLSKNFVQSHPHEDTKKSKKYIQSQHHYDPQMIDNCVDRIKNNIAFGANRKSVMSTHSQVRFSFYDDNITTDLEKYSDTQVMDCSVFTNNDNHSSNYRFNKILSHSSNSDIFENPNDLNKMDDNDYQLLNVDNEANKPVKSTKIIILIDDNMFYKSMRYRTFQLARKYCIGYCQLYLKVSVNLAILRNSQRQVDPNSKVPAILDKTIIKMSEKLDIPNVDEDHIISSCQSSSNLRKSVSRKSVDSENPDEVPSRGSLKPASAHPHHHLEPTDDGPLFEDLSTKPNSAVQSQFKKLNKNNWQKNTLHINANRDISPSIKNIYDFCVSCCHVVSTDHISQSRSLFPNGLLDTDAFDSTSNSLLHVIDLGLRKYVTNFAKKLQPSVVDKTAIIAINQDRKDFLKELRFHTVLYKKVLEAVDPYLSHIDDNSVTLHDNAMIDDSIWEIFDLWRLSYSFEQCCI